MESIYTEFFALRMAYLGAGLAVLTGIGPGIGQGYAAGKAGCLSDREWGQIDLPTLLPSHLSRVVNPTWTFDGKGVTAMSHPVHNLSGYKPPEVNQ